MYDQKNTFNAREGDYFIWDLKLGLMRQDRKQGCQE